MLAGVMGRPGQLSLEGRPMCWSGWGSPFQFQDGMPSSPAPREPPKAHSPEIVLLIDPAVRIMMKCLLQLLQPVVRAQTVLGECLPSSHLLIPCALCFSYIRSGGGHPKLPYCGLCSPKTQEGLPSVAQFNYSPLLRETKLISILPFGTS